VTFVPYGDVAALEAAVDADTAAVLLEPIQGEAGVVVPPDGYLAAARVAADRAGALLWFDEVQTGVGRTGNWFAYQGESVPVLPDVVTLAKGLGAGFPIGACLGLGAAGELFGPGHHGSTFGGNPLGAAVALTVLDVIEIDRLREQARLVGRRLRTELSRLNGVTAVRGRGLLVAADVQPGQAKAAAAAALHGGVIVNDCTPDTLRFAPPLILDDHDVEHAVPVLAAALAADHASLEAS